MISKRAIKQAKMSALALTLALSACGGSPPPGPGGCASTEEGCGLGKGPCLLSQKRTCSGSLTCAAARGGQYEQDATLNVCVPSHCVNGQLDAAFGEVKIDCGGGCGTCPLDPTPPQISKVQVIYDRSDATGRVLRCQYDYSDLNQAPDQSKVQWLLNDVLQDTSSSSFDAYSPGDAVYCRVTAHNGTLQGNTITSQRVRTPKQLTLAITRQTSCALVNSEVVCWGPDQYNEDDGAAPSSSPNKQARFGADNIHIATNDEGKLCTIQRGALTCYDPNQAKLERHTSLERGVSFASINGASCAIQYGALKCWGNNPQGRLGDGTKLTKLEPTQVLGMQQGVTDVSTAALSTCAVQSGALKCWGEISILARGDSWSNPVPQLIPGLETGVTQVSASSTHICAIQDGALKCWDNNAPPQPGVDPVEVVPGMESGVTWVNRQVAHTCAIQDGALKCWGSNISSRLGTATTLNTETPTQVIDLTQDVTEVALGFNHTCARQGEAIKCWGDNSVGQLAREPKLYEPEPTQAIGIDADATQLALSSTHTCAIQAGALKCWGINNLGQLGDNGYSPQSTPTPATGMQQGVTWVSANDSRTCAVQDGALKCWGATFERFSSAQPTPTPIDELQTGVTQVVVGIKHGCALQEGAVKCWGDNSSAQLGVDQPQQSATPLQVPGLTQDVTALFVYENHTCAIQAGALKCWGEPAQRWRYNLQDNATRGPVTIHSLEANVTHAFIGANISCAQQNNTLKCWGQNIMLAQSSVDPTPHPIAASASQISPGELMACMIDAGAASCWGDTYTIERPPTSAVPLDGLDKGVTQLVVQLLHSCAIQDGAVKCWGDNTFGQLGDGSLNISATPLTIPLD